MKEPISETLLNVLACPGCRGGLHLGEDGLVCPRCMLCYPVEDGIPLMTLDRAIPLGERKTQ